MSGVDPDERTEADERGVPWVDRAEGIVERARDGQDVANEIRQLPPAWQQQVNTVIETGRIVLGLPSGDAPLPMHSDSQRLELGLLAERYAIESELGRGGMGVVYLATDQRTQRRVVVKVMTLDKAWNPRLRARFEREAEALKKIHRHPNVVEVLDVGQDPAQGPFLVMEFVEGIPLVKAIVQRGRLSAAEATRIARDVARGLAVVHRHGLLHRDVKPANVMLTPEGRAKLVDFGLAKDAFRSSLTKSGQLLGTSYYMAPEQWLDDVKEDARCDVFALGATLYHMLSGEPPFEGDDLGEVMDACLSGDFEPPDEVVPDLPPELELVLLQMLQTDRQFRYFRMADCADDLERALRGEPSQVPCLVEEGGGTRYPLVKGRRWTLGRDAGCEVCVVDATVSREHAQIRREEAGFALRDLNSSHGTSVNGQRLTEAWTLQDGNVVDLGDVRLAFRDPNSRPHGPAFLQDVAREHQPDPIVRLLVAQRDRRTVLHLLERLQLERYEEQRVHQALSGLLGLQVAQAVSGLRAQQPSRALARLVGITGDGGRRDLESWLAWWDYARLEHPVQVGSGQPRKLRLRASSGEQLDIGPTSPTMLLVGRDAKCHLRIGDGTVSRLHATLLRTHRRWLVRDEGSAAGVLKGEAPLKFAFLDPGDTLQLGEVRLVLEEVDPLPIFQPLGGNGYLVDATTFEALLDLRHPSVAQALNQFLTVQPPVERLRQVYAERANLARQVLPTLSGPPGPQVLPAGWF